jgi:hypothetical protein
MGKTLRTQTKKATTGNEKGLAEEFTAASGLFVPGGYGMVAGGT